MDWGSVISNSVTVASVFAGSLLVLSRGGSKAVDDKMGKGSDSPPAN